MGRYVPWRGRMGDGPERGNIRIERLLREKAMMDAKAVLGTCTCNGVWLCQYIYRTRIYFDV